MVMAMLDYRARTFITAYRLRTYTKAAEALHITQSAVSQHIRQLEHHYGCALFTTSSRGIVPTAAGEVVYRTLSTLENDELRLQGELDALQASRATRPPLRFGCTRTIADYAAPPILAAHLARHPDERVQMRSGNTRELLAALDAGTIDFALVEGPFDRSRYDGAVLTRERIIAIAQPGTPQAATVSELTAHPLVLREAGSGTREIVERHLAARDLAPADFRQLIEIASIPTIKACVGATDAVGFLYRVAAEKELATGELVDITPPDLAIEHDFTLIWQRGSSYAPTWRALARSWHQALERSTPNPRR